MLLQVMLFTGPVAQNVGHHLASRLALGHPVVERASFSIPDTLFLFVVALVVFGPKRLPEIGKQIGKLVFEFRRASNDFKLQIEEELRVAEQQDRQKQLEMQAAVKMPSPAVTAAQPAATTSTAPAVTESAETTVPEPPERRRVEESGPTIQPPSTGLPVSAQPPNHAATTAPIPAAPAPVAPEIESTPAEAIPAAEPTTARHE